MSGGSARGVVGAISINNISTVKVCMTKYNYGYPYLAQALKEIKVPIFSATKLFTRLSNLASWAGCQNNPIFVSPFYLYLVQLIQTTNMNLKFLEGKSCLFTF